MQGALEGALAQLAGEPVRANLAGRTDAGVHAWGQTASLLFPTRPGLDTPGAVKRALNGSLPGDVAVAAAEEVDKEFHARFSARQRAYRYLLLNSPEPMPLLRRYSLHVRRPLESEAMREAAGLLVGTHDLAAFAGQGMGVPLEGERGKEAEKPGTVRTVYLARLRLLPTDANFWQWDAPEAHHGEMGEGKAGPRLLVLDFVANAFLPQMIRTIVGTLLEVGHGKRTVEEMRTILEGRDRRQAGPTARPHGLCLLWVSY